MILSLLIDLYVVLAASLLIGGAVSIAVSRLLGVEISLARNISRVILVILLIYLVLVIPYIASGDYVSVGLFSFLRGIDWVFVVIVLAVLLSGFIVVSSYPEDLGDIVFVLSVTLVGILGSMLMTISIDPVAIIVSWALLSISSYSIIALFRDPDSLDASSRYIVVGVVASQFLLFGLGFFILSSLASPVSITGSVVSRDYVLVSMMLSVVMLLVAIGFKLGSAPFHFWLPDVYGRASPYAIAAIAGVIKIGLVGLLLRLAMYYSGYDLFVYSVILLSLLSMLIGSLTPLTQRNIQRIMAFSSINHVGFILIGVAVISIVYRLGVYAYTAALFALVGVLLHVLAYSLSKSSMFVLIGFMRRVYGSADLSVVSLSSEKPGLLKFSTVIHLANLIGVPPLPGFWGKLFIFLSATYNDPRLYIGSVPWLALLGVIASVISVFYYLNIIRAVSLETSPLSKDRSSGSPRDLVYPYISSILVIVIGLIAPLIYVYARFI